MRSRGSRRQASKANYPEELPRALYKQYDKLVGVCIKLDDQLRLLSAATALQTAISIEKTADSLVGWMAVQRRVKFKLDDLKKLLNYNASIYTIKEWKESVKAELQQKMTLTFDSSKGISQGIVTEEVMSISDFIVKSAEDVKPYFNRDYDIDVSYMINKMDAGTFSTLFESIEKISDGELRTRVMTNVLDAILRNVDKLIGSTQDSEVIMRQLDKLMVQLQIPFKHLTDKAQVFYVQPLKMNAVIAQFKKAHSPPSPPPEPAAAPTSPASPNKQKMLRARSTSTGLIVDRLPIARKESVPDTTKAEPVIPSLKTDEEETSSKEEASSKDPTPPRSPRQ